MENGDYVRTKYGIAKIEEIKPDKKHNTIWYTVDKAQYHCFLTREQEIIKSSPNIIDLIEAGDYVNEERVFGFGKFKYDDGTEEITSLTLDKTISCLPEDIKSIVTREQFESMEYKVEK